MEKIIAVERIAFEIFRGTESIGEVMQGRDGKWNFFPYRGVTFHTDEVRMILDKMENAEKREIKING
jgi:hypothetical protein